MATAAGGIETIDPGLGALAIGLSATPVPASALQNSGAVAAAQTSWGDIVEAEEDREQASHAAASEDICPVLQDMDLINAVRLAHPDQVDQVTDGIARSLRTVLSRVNILVMLYVLFNQWQDLGNFLREHILHGFHQGAHYRLWLVVTVVSSPNTPLSCALS